LKAWFCIPSARPAAEANLALRKWHEKGYGIALWRDSENELPACDMYLMGRYPGYAQAVNAIAKMVFDADPEARWIIDGGDDTLPDLNHSPDQIAGDCESHFGGTFGVMQPTGDRWAAGSIDRIAGSAWMGREWCERANGGTGPLWYEFAHMFVDQCLLDVATKCGVYWPRPDLAHLHRHFSRKGEEVNRQAQVPAHLVKWNTPKHWDEMQAVYLRLKGMNFAPCMPLAA
jgi:hypothetical protein